MKELNAWFSTMLGRSKMSFKFSSRHRKVNNCICPHGLDSRASF
ncbi:hypothetical protein OROGR_033178 [Orobanche gracilis]